MTEDYELTAALGMEQYGHQQTPFGRVALVGSKMVRDVDVGVAMVPWCTAVWSDARRCAEMLYPIESTAKAYQASYASPVNVRGGSGSTCRVGSRVGRVGSRCPSCPATTPPWAWFCLGPLGCIGADFCPSPSVGVAWP